MSRGSSLPSTSPDLPLPERLGRFPIVRPIGRGGMAWVFEGLDPQLGRRVAIKLLDPGDDALSATLRARFAREARITATLQHPNIVAVHEEGVADDGAQYFVMSLVRGRSLAQVLLALRERDPDAEVEWTPRRLLSAFAQVCNGVAYAHSRGVLHRDLKPANVMLGEFGEVLVMDWGVARALEGSDLESDGLDLDSAARSGSFDTAADSGEPARSPALTRDGFQVGTAGYMSPEQVRAQRDLDPRSDVWSLGAILYEILTLEPAYEGVTDEDLFAATLAGLPTDPRLRSPALEIPAAIAEIAMQALAPRREHRHRNASHLAVAVHAFLDGSQRRERARRSLVAADEAWRDYKRKSLESHRLRLDAERLQTALPPWAPLRAKAELLTTFERLEQLDLERTRAFGSVVRHAEQALVEHPGDADAHEVLARGYLSRFEDAEESNQHTLALFYEERVRAHDDGRHEAALRGTGSISLSTEPLGAEVLCAPVDRRGLRWRLGEARPLGRTPLLWAPLEMGSYVLTLTHGDRPPVTYPVCITRRHHWDSGDVPVRIPRAEEHTPDAVYVARGPFRAGGDPEADDALPGAWRFVEGFFVSTFPVTREQYREFLAELPEQEAADRAPRGPNGGRPPDSAGLLFDGDLPVCGVSWHDAMAYAFWIAHREQLPWQLPPELWWEKAARGVDGRLYPWGDRFDHAITKTRDSREGLPAPEPVGTFPDDCSVYGARDLAGGMREWCGDLSYRDDPRRRPIRGGSWIGVGRQCRGAHRSGAEPEGVFVSVGFRLARRS